jgi:hypothetical protein
METDATRGIEFFPPAEREKIVDAIFQLISESEQSALFAWMAKRGLWEVEKYYGTMLAIAQIAFLRGAVTRHQMLRVLVNIRRERSIQTFLQLPELQIPL